MLRRLVILALAACAGCASPPSEPPRITTWGTMREALKLGHSEARVRLASIDPEHAIGVGALAGLAGEITIVDGRVLIATANGTECHVGEAGDDEAATLLVHATVAHWQDHALPDCASYDELETAIAAHLDRLGRDRREPVPVRIRGRGTRVAYHVIAGACPIADPTGPPPWRFDGALDDLELVGIYVEDAAGRLTHHVHRSHLHLVAPGRTGHLDEIALVDPVLSLPTP